MILRIPKTLHSKLVAPAPGQQTARYKVHMPNGRTHYAVEIDSGGVILRIDGRRIYSGADVGFHIAVIRDIEPY